MEVHTASTPIPEGLGLYCQYFGWLMTFPFGTCVASFLYLRPIEPWPYIDKCFENVAQNNI